MKEAQEIKVCKADPLGEEEIQSVILKITEELPHIFLGNRAVVKAQNVYKLEAEKVMAALEQLPQGTRYELLILMLQNSPILYRGRQRR